MSEEQQTSTGGQVDPDHRPGTATAAPAPGNSGTATTATTGSTASSAAVPGPRSQPSPDEHVTAPVGPLLTGPDAGPHPGGPGTHPDSRPGGAEHHPTGPVTGPLRRPEPRAAAPAGDPGAEQDRPAAGPGRQRPRPRMPRMPSGDPLTRMGPWAPVAGAAAGLVLGIVVALVLAGSAATFDERLALVFVVLGLTLLGAGGTLLADEVRLLRRGASAVEARTPSAGLLVGLLNGLTPARLMILTSAFVLLLSAYVTQRG